MLCYHLFIMTKGNIKPSDVINMSIEQKALYWAMMAEYGKEMKEASKK